MFRYAPPLFAIRVKLVVGFGVSQVPLSQQRFFSHIHQDIACGISLGTDSVTHNGFEFFEYSRGHLISIV